MKKILIISFIFILAFSVRLIYIYTSPDILESDEIQHDKLAMRLMEAKGYVNSEGVPTSYRPPLYPAFLALIYKIFGHNYFIARIIQAIISSLTVCMLYLIAEKIFNRPAAILTGIFSSFYMAFVVCAKLLYTETFFTFFLVLATFLIITTEKPGIAKFSILGLLLGLLTLVRAAGLFMPFVAVIALSIKMRGQKPVIKKLLPSFLALFVAFSAVILPWTIRNYRIHKRFVLISTNAGVNIYQAVKPVGGKIIGLGPRGDELSREAFSISNETERNDFFIKAALNAYKEDPLNALKMFVMRFLFFWNVIDWEIIGGETINYHFIFILPFAIFGTIFSLKNRKDISLLLLMILYFTSLVLIFQGTPRYRMPIDGYIIILGGYGIYEVVHRQRKKTYPIFFISAYFFLTYLLYRYSLQTKYFIRGLMEKIGLW